MVISDLYVSHGQFVRFSRQLSGQRAGVAARDGNQGPRSVQIWYFLTSKTPSEARFRPRSRAQNRILDLNIASHGMEQAKKKKAEEEWSNDEHRNGLFLSWRLRLRTSGIY